MKKILNLIDELFAFESNIFIYSLSFSLLLALTPTIIIAMMLFGFSDQALVEVIIQSITNIIPSTIMSADTVRDLLTTFITEGSILSTIPTLGVSLWLGSRSVFSFMMIAARQEHVDVPKWSIRVKALFTFSTIIVAIVLGLLLVLRTPFLGAKLFNVRTAYIVSAIALIAFYFLYRSISFKVRPWTYGMAGSLFSIVVTTIAFRIMRFLVFDQYGRYKNLYGSLAILVVLFLFIYVIAYIIYVGYLINNVFAKDYGKEHQLALKMPAFFNWAKSISDEFGNWILGKGGHDENNNKEDGD